MNTQNSTTEQRSAEVKTNPEALEGHMTTLGIFITNDNHFSQYFLGSLDLAGLDEFTAAALFWRGEPQTLNQGSVMYAEGEPLDDTFCLLVSGDLVVERAGDIIDVISVGQIFGEMAYFTNYKVRTATVRVGSAEAVVVRFRLTQAELCGTRFSALRSLLFRQSWQKFVSASQSQTACPAAPAPLVT